MAGQYWQMVCTAMAAALTISLASGEAAPEGNCFAVPSETVALQSATPAAGYDAAFGRLWVGWSGAPITHIIRAEPGRKYTIVAGVMEPYWGEAGKRAVGFDIEGEYKGSVDLFKEAGGRNTPIGVKYLAEDKDGDGWIRFRAVTPGGEDRNVVMSGLWVFDTADEASISVDDVIRGRLNDRAYGYSPAREPNAARRRIDSVGDARLCIGNGHFLAAFVGPMEEPEEPAYKVFDKISRLWLGYSSPQLCNIGMAPTVKDLKTGKSWTVGPCDRYRFEDGAVIMETDIEVGTVRTETYGLWDKPVLVRRMTFHPKAGSSGRFRLSTSFSLFSGSPKGPVDPALAKLRWAAYAQDERERPPILAFPKREELAVSRGDGTATWTYDDPNYRKAAVGVIEDARMTIDGTRRSRASFVGDGYGRLSVSRECGAGGGSITVTLAFGADGDAAAKALADARATGVPLAETQKRWNEWFESGAVVRTGVKRLDDAYRVQAMYLKVAQDAELGGMIVGGRYYITTVWTRDSGVAISEMLDAGHYEEARKALRFFSRHMNWNERNNCLHANSHSSGRTWVGFCSANQPSVEGYLQPHEWEIQMNGPQLDGMAYYLYCIGKYYRCTGDLQFVREEWPFVTQVADSLAADGYCVSECGPQGGYTDASLRFRKYSQETGLIVDNCTEGGTLREHLLTNAIAVLGFRNAYSLSVAMGSGIDQWKARAESIDAGIRKFLLKRDSQGPYALCWVPRPWLDNGAESHIGSSGYFWSCAATVPYFNYAEPDLKAIAMREISPDLKIGGWGMWWAGLAHAAFGADLAETGWNYLKQVTAQLPESLQLYELNQNVVSSDGTSRQVALSLYCFSYMQHAMVRGLAGFGFNEYTGRYYLRPQVPDEIGAVRAQVRAGETLFDVKAAGHGSEVASFRIDGADQPLDGVIDPKYLDGKRHSAEIRMK